VQGVRRDKAGGRLLPRYARGRRPAGAVPPVQHAVLQPVVRAAAPRKETGRRTAKGLRHLRRGEARRGAIEEDTLPCTLVSTYERVTAVLAWKFLLIVVMFHASGSLGIPLCIHVHEVPNHISDLWAPAALRQSACSSPETDQTHQTCVCVKEQEG
jgi:hypothetical protein